MISKQPENYQILLVEDDLDLQAGVAEYLTRIGYTVTAVSTGLGFYCSMSEQTFNAAIIDLGLPDIPGMQLVEFIYANRDMPCIIQTAQDRVEDRVRGYETGADLYMVKPVDCRELASALGRLLTRKYGESPREKFTEYWSLQRDGFCLLAPGGATVSLSYREFGFLRCLSMMSQQPVPRQKILASLDYADDESSHRALESLVRRLRRKLESVTGINPIQTCHGIGYAFSQPLSPP